MTGNSLIDKILAALNFFVVLGSLALVVKANMLTHPPTIDQNAEEKSIEDQVNNVRNIKYFKMDKLVVNLPGRSKRLRYLDIEVHLRPFKNSQIPLMEEQKARIADAIIDVAGRMTPRDLGTLSGKILLEQRIKNRINSMYDNPTVEKIFYSKFIIQ